MVLLIGATLVLCSYNNSIKAKLTLPAFFTLLLLCLSNGGIDFSQKLFTVYAPDVPTAVFNFYTYIFAFVFLIICLPFFKTPREAGGRIGHPCVTADFRLHRCDGDLSVPTQLHQNACGTLSAERCALSARQWLCAHAFDRDGGAVFRRKTHGQMSLRCGTCVFRCFRSQFVMPRKNALQSLTEPVKRDKMFLSFITAAQRCFCVRRTFL